MELIVKGQFFRDIAKICDVHLLEAIRNKALEVENAEKIIQIQNLKKLRKYKTQYRIKVDDEYRIGAVIRSDKIWFVRFGHRNIFYKKFP